MRLVMVGTGTFAEPAFLTILGSLHTVVGLVTQPDRQVGHERGSTRQADRGLKTIARERGIPILQPENINSAEGCSALAALGPDLLVVAAYGQILSKEILGLAARGGVNIHASLLPRYRGAAPVAWAIYQGETQTGVTIIQMSVYLDAGVMLAQEALAIGPEETAGELESRLAQLGARLTVGVIDQIAAGTAQGMPQDRSQATRAPKLTKEHGLIEWSRPAAAVCNQVRAMQPWPTAYSFWQRPGSNPMRIIVHKAVAASDQFGLELTPGQVLPTAGESRLVAAAGDGRAVEILELQPAGRRRMTAAEFVRGHRLHPGDRLGPESA
jgi:methionyl-tRNA formyltransferase